MNPTLTLDGANRMAIGLARARGLRYQEAEEELRNLSLRLVWTLPGSGSLAQQLALLTAANSAARAFLGGVQVELPDEIPLVVSISGVATLNGALGWAGVSSVALSNPTCTLYLGEPDARAQPDDVVIFCDAWRGGAGDVRDETKFLMGDQDHLGLGGIFAGALAVHRCFVRAAHLPGQCLDQTCGLSLWDPSADWRQPVKGVRLRQLPIRYWMLGLGHLGQGYLWSLAFLPFPDVASVEFLLHDFDQIDESNFGSGVICIQGALRRKKTRHCAAWLERLGFSTSITERRFTTADRRSDDDPAIAFCGFDNVSARQGLDTAGFGLVLECGLGGSLADFDQIDLHTFPSPRHSAHSLWGAFSDRKGPISDAIAQLFASDVDEVCGALAIDIAGKSVSTSFVGAIAGALATAEMLRVFNRGAIFDDTSFDLRNPLRHSALASGQRFKASELAAMGVVSVSAPESKPGSDADNFAYEQRTRRKLQRIPILSE
jgi:hypothetical protein